MKRSPGDTALEYVACLREGDFPRLVTLHHPDLVCSLLGTSGVSGRYRGRDAFFAHTFKHVLGKLAETDESYLKDYRIGCASDHRAALLLHGGLPTRRGGRYDQHYLQIFHVVDGLIVEIHELLDTVMLETEIFDRTLRQPRSMPAEPLRPSLAIAAAPAPSGRLEPTFSAALAAGEWRTCGATLHEDAVLQIAGSTPMSGTIHGRTAIERYWADHFARYFATGSLKFESGSRLAFQDSGGFCRMAIIQARTHGGADYRQTLGIIGTYRGDSIAALQLYFDTAAEEEQTYNNPLSPGSIPPSSEPFCIESAIA